MKKLTHIVITACLAMIQSAQAQSFGLEIMRTNTVLNVPDGLVYELISATAPYGNIDYNPSSFTTSSVVIEKSGRSTSFVAAPYNNDNRNIKPDPNSWVHSGDNSSFFVPGPATIRYGSNTQAGNPEITLNYKILSNLSASTNFVSSTAVVIPQSATGDVDVKMEQSADNVTWTECLPGTYNSSTVKRFFRLRAVEK